MFVTTMKKRQSFEVLTWYAMYARNDSLDAGCDCDVSKWRKTNAWHAGCYGDVSRWRRFRTDQQPL